MLQYSSWKAQAFTQPVSRDATNETVKGGEEGKRRKTASQCAQGLLPSPSPSPRCSDKMYGELSLAAESTRRGKEEQEKKQAEASTP